METKMIYATKYALTKGIEHIEVRLSCHDDIVIENIRYGRSFMKDEWFENKADAIKNAEERKNKKIKSLEKQLQKMMKIKF